MDGINIGMNKNGLDILINNFNQNYYSREEVEEKLDKVFRKAYDIGYKRGWYDAKNFEKEEEAKKHELIISKDMIEAALLYIERENNNE